MDGWDIFEYMEGVDGKEGGLEMLFSQRTSQKRTSVTPT